MTGQKAFAFVYDFPYDIGPRTCRGRLRNTVSADERPRCGRTSVEIVLRCGVTRCRSCGLRERFGHEYVDSDAPARSQPLGVGSVSWRAAATANTCACVLPRRATARAIARAMGSWSANFSGMTHCVNGSIQGWTRQCGILDQPIVFIFPSYSASG